LGEKEDDLELFRAEDYAKALMSSSWLNLSKLKVYNIYIHKVNSYFQIRNP
jgi:hypothetical protein